MMREAIRFEILYGHFNDALEILNEIDQQVRAKNLPGSKVLAPLHGVANVLLVESEYASMAAYEEANKVFYADPDIMKNVRRLSGVTVQGSTTVELADDSVTSTTLA